MISSLELEGEPGEEPATVDLVIQNGQRLIGIGDGCKPFVGKVLALNIDRQTLQRAAFLEIIADLSIDDQFA